MQEHFKNYFSYLAVTGLSERTIANRKEELKYFQRFLCDQNIDQLNQITPQVLATFQTWLYNYTSRFNRPLVIGGQRNILYALKTFYAFLIKTKVVAHDPSKSLAVPSAPKQLPKTILTDREMKRLLSQPDLQTLLGYRDRTILELFYCTGLRIGEMVELALNDIHWPTRELHVIGKGLKPRTLPLGRIATEFLQLYHNQIRPLLKNCHDSQILFLSYRGTPLNPRALGRVISGYARKARIKKPFTAHCFRHTLATSMLSRGADLRSIQLLLGHGDLETTKIYLQVIKKELKRVHRKTHPREQIDLPANAIEFIARGQRSEVRGQRSEARGQKPEARGQKPEVRSQKPEVRSQKPEVRGQRSVPEVRGQKPEVRSQRSVPEVRGEELKPNSEIQSTSSG